MVVSTAQLLLWLLSGLTGWQCSFGCVDETVGAWLFDGSTGWSEARLEGKNGEAGTE
jgi:hypothetical protein